MITMIIMKVIMVRFGEVQLVVRKATGEQFAAKTIQARCLFGSDHIFMGQWTMDIGQWTIVIHGMDDGQNCAAKTMQARWFLPQVML